MPLTMQHLLNINKDYLKWFSEIKNKIRSTQIRAALAANATLIEFYYDLGRMIVEKQAQSTWGDKLVQQLSKDLQVEFPEMSGFSYSNLKFCKQFFNYFQFCRQTEGVIGQQTVSQLQNAGNKSAAICQQSVSKLNSLSLNELSLEANEKLKKLIFNTPWGHIIQIINKVKDPQNALFYLLETQKNAWVEIYWHCKSRMDCTNGKAKP